MFKEKKLYKSTNKMVDGVCAGIAEYFEIDPTIVRVVYILASLILGLGFGGVVLYVILALVIPRRPFPDYQYNEFQNGENRPNEPKE